MLPAKSRALTPTPLPKAGEGLPIARSVRRVTLPSPQSPVPAPPPMRIDIISLFPEFVAQVAGHGVVGRAQERGLLSLLGWNPRDHAEGNYRRVDDRPFGGGPGMVMMIDPPRACPTTARAAGQAPARVVYLRPPGRTITQARVRALAAEPRVLRQGRRYEGVAERQPEDGA